MRTHYCGLVTEALMGQTVQLCGWVNRRRDHGGVIFVDLRDREGHVQVVCDPDRPDMFKAAEGLRNEFCVQIKGLVRARPEGTTNPNLKSGEIEILCHELDILNASVTPPFLLDDEGSIVSNPTLGSFWDALQPPPGGDTVSGRPLLNVSFALSHALSGLDVWGYHLLNVLIQFRQSLIH